MEGERRAGRNWRLAMNTGRATISLLLVLAAMAGGCASQQPDAILSAADLESMIHVEVRIIEPADTMIAANDQP